MSEAYHATKVESVKSDYSAIENFPNCTEEDLITEIEGIHRGTNSENFENIIKLSELKASVISYGKSFEQGSRKIA